MVMLLRAYRSASTKSLNPSGSVEFSSVLFPKGPFALYCLSLHPTFCVLAPLKDGAAPLPSRSKPAMTALCAPPTHMTLRARTGLCLNTRSSATSCLTSRLSTNPSTCPTADRTGDTTMFDVLSRMMRTGLLTETYPPSHRISELQKQIRGLLGRALSIRQVDAGSCNGCEFEIHALNNPYYNLERFGIKFVASPCHADLLLVIGRVSVNMADALQRTYDAVPDPKFVVAVGDCGTCGGVFGASYASCGAVANIIPVHVTIPGCPPHPVNILEGILRAISPSFGPPNS